MTRRDAAWTGTDILSQFKRVIRTNVFRLSLWERAGPVESLIRLSDEYWYGFECLSGEWLYQRVIDTAAS